MYRLALVLFHHSWPCTGPAGAVSEIIAERKAVIALAIAVTTNAVVAIEVSLSPAVGVGAAGLPVNVGDAMLALPATPDATSVITNDVVAIRLVLSPGDGTVVVGEPVNAGLASGAFSARSLTRLVMSACAWVWLRLAFSAIFACTCAVVAIDVSLSAVAGVGALGSPVNVGDANGALAARSVVRLMTSDSG